MTIVAKTELLQRQCYKIFARQIKNSCTLQLAGLDLISSVCIIMDLLSQYKSSSVSSSETSEPSEDDLQLTPQQLRSVYVLTYSQADLGIFPDQESFATAVCEAVTKCEGPKVKVIQWHAVKRAINAEESTTIWQSN